MREMLHSCRARGRKAAKLVARDHTDQSAGHDLGRSDYFQSAIGQYDFNPLSEEQDKIQLTLHRKPLPTTTIWCLCARGG